jgi:DNA-binding NtrC family response regulator
VSLYLPALQAEERANVAPAYKGVEDASGRGTILVVEDDPEVAELTMQVLERGGYAVQLVDHAAAALAVLGGTQPINLVFSDVIMPGGINGIALAEEIGKVRPELPVLLASGYADAVKDAEAKELMILRKPYQPDDLVKAVETMLARRQSS